MKSRLGLIILVASGCVADDGELAKRSVALSAEEFPFLVADAPVERSTIPDATARELARSHLRPGEELRMVDTIYFSALGRTFVRAVAASPSDARLLLIDESGREDDLEVIEIADRASRYARYGKLSPRLLGALDAGSSEDQAASFFVEATDVLPMDLDEAAPGEDSRLSDKERFLLRSSIQRERIRAALAEAKRPLLAWLKAHGATEVELLENLPLVSATLPASALRLRELQEFPGLLSVDAPPEPMLPRGYSGHGSMESGLFTGGSCLGGTCEGINFVSVGIWEGNTVNTRLGIQNTRFGVNTWRAPPTANPNTEVAPRICSVTPDCSSGISGEDVKNGYVCVSGTCVNQHATGVAAAIGMQGSYTDNAVTDPMTMTHPTWPKAGAYDHDDIFYASVSNYVGLNWLLEEPGMFYVNRSLPFPNGGNTISQWWATVDWAVRTDLMTLTYAEAEGDPLSLPTTDHYSWNSLSVGAYNYGTSTGTSDDVVANYTGWQNNGVLGASVERPHLLGTGGVPGHELKLAQACSSSNAIADTYCSYSTKFVGTSFAAPAVLGFAILAHEYSNYFSYMSDPLVRKLVLLIGAVNLHGAVYPSGADEHDGVGRVSGTRTKAIIDNGAFKRYSVTPAQINGGAEVELRTISVGVNNKLRVGISWNSCAGTNPNINRLMDFDFYLVRPTQCGSTVVSSTGVGEFEILNDSCLIGAGGAWGDYKVRVKKKAGTPNLVTCGSETSEKIAVVWDITN